MERRIQMAKITKRDGKIIDLGSLPRDHPKYLQGWRIGSSNLSAKSERNIQREATEETDSESLPSETREE